MCQIKRTNGYECPVCHTVYKRKGKYLNMHLKKCNAIAWIPSTIIEIKMKTIEENKFSDAIDKLIAGDFTVKQDQTEWNLRKNYEKCDKIAKKTGRGTTTDFKGVVNEIKELGMDIQSTLIRVDEPKYIVSEIFV